MDTVKAVDALTHISEKPWSDYTKADYTIEQWHAACLIHLHSGPPTSKNECKLPVKTPSGALNRNGVHAAAAALAGARTPLQAPPEQKAKAATSLRGYYRQLGEQPPPSLVKHSGLELVEEVLEHFGVKGMKWGVRRKATVGPQEVVVRDSRNILRKKLKTSGGAGHPAHPEAVRVRTIGQIGKKSGLHAVSDKDLRDYANRLQLEANVKRLNYNESNAGKRFLLRLLGQAGEREATGLTKIGARQARRGAVRTGRRALIKAGVIAAAA